MVIFMRILLKDTFPELIGQIDSEKNMGIVIEALTRANSKRLWWKCPVCGGSWRSAVYNRTINRTGCPYCSKKNPKASFKNSLAVMRPELIKYWDYKQNGDLRPEYTCYQTHRKVWWKCINNSEHSYLANVQSRSKGFGNRCPICAKENKLLKQKAKRKEV